MMPILILIFLYLLGSFYFLYLNFLFEYRNTRESLEKSERKEQALKRVKEDTIKYLAILSWIIVILILLAIISIGIGRLFSYIIHKII